MGDTDLCPPLFLHAVKSAHRNAQQEKYRHDQFHPEDERYARCQTHVTGRFPVGANGHFPRVATGKRRAGDEVASGKYNSYRDERQNWHPSEPEEQCIAHRKVSSTETKSGEHGRHYTNGTASDRQPACEETYGGNRPPVGT